MTASAHRFASLTDNRITSRLGDIKRNVLNLGEQLEGRVYGRAAGFLNGLLDGLATHTCRIAVIGQMKAGKSTLINALMQRPGLLPTDVNPSTAVITKLHFGAAPEKANTALFQFFSDDEWDRIMSGGRAGAMAPRRQLTHKPDQLGKPLEDLQRRAEKRLGADYSKNLGKHHLFSSVTTGTLERYVSAGDYADDGGSDEDGQFFSDITKSADVFLEGQPLGYPAVIIDTPGVNDPFLVREEITQGNLGEADIYLVVLTAQQPLSSSDLALLRMLKGLQKDRVIAVVNRVDIIDGLAAHSERLIAHIKATLAREFPHANIPVILASAHWANAALSGDELELADVITPSFVDYAADLARRGENRLGRPTPSWSNEQVAQLAYHISGVPRIVATITRLIGYSVTAERLLPAASTFGAVAENMQAALRYGVKSLDNTSVYRAGNEEEWFRAGALASLEQLEKVSSLIEDTMDAARAEFEALVREELARLRKSMSSAVEKFASAERDRLLQAGSYGTMQKGFQERSFQFRSGLAEAFFKYFTETAKQLQSKQQEAENGLRRTMKAALPDLDDILRFGVQPGELPSPSIIALSKMTALDLDNFWQQRILAGGNVRDPAEAEDFKQCIVAAFAELIAELFAAADETLKIHIDDAVRRLQFLSYSAIYPIAHQLRQWVKVHKTMSNDEGGGAFREQILGESQEQLRHCEELAAMAAGIRRQCMQLMEP